jgi:hypothetical protein
VLGGEDPIDHVQRQALRSETPIHPLLKRIMQIHVTEEARHLCFARQYLKNNVPRLGWARRLMLQIRTPVILAVMSQMMMRPSPQIVRTYRIPRRVIAAAYTKNPVHRTRTLEAIRKVRELCDELGLLTPLSIAVWKVLGLWQVEPSAPASAEHATV